MQGLEARRVPGFSMVPTSPTPSIPLQPPPTPGRGLERVGGVGEGWLGARVGLVHGCKGKARVL